MAGKKPASRNTVFFQRGHSFYLVGGVSALTPKNPSEEFAYGSNLIDGLRGHAPNEYLGWLGGHYMEADKPNRNGAMWTAGDLAIKALTPNLMPVTVMHDPNLSVGMIADAKLLTPDQHDVPRAKIETALGIWKHRYPDVYEEALHNLSEGTLAQSMECVSTHYECSVCGESFRQADNDPTAANSRCSKSCDNASRILRNFTFAGTGLIFGSRGASPGDPEASLELLAEEVAEFHQRAKTPPKSGRDLKPKRKKGVVEIDDDKYEALVAKAAKAEGIEAMQAELANANAKVAENEAGLLKMETEKVAAETANAELAKKLKAHEDKANETVLRTGRLAKLGGGFTAKLGDIAKSRLSERAGALSDEEWASYLTEVEELVGVPHTEGAATDDKDDANKEDAVDTARFQGGRSSGPMREPTATERTSAYAGLL